MSLRADTTQLVSPGLLASLYAGHGVVAADVPSTGTHGPSLLYPNVVENSWVAQELRLVVLSHTFAAITVDEAGRMEATVSGDGSYGVTFEIWLDGALAGTASVSVLVGAFDFTATVAITESGDDAVTSTVTVVEPSGGVVDVTAAIRDSSDDVPGMSVQITGASVQIPGPDPYPVVVWADSSLGNSTPERRYKQPGEVIDFDFDYSRWFARRTDEPLTAYVETPVLVSGETAVTLVNYWLLGNRIKVMLSGGSNRSRHKITARMTTSSGAVEEVECFVTVREN